MISAETLLPLLKESARVSTTKFDSLQLTHLINAAQADLGIAGVMVPDEYDAVVDQAIIMYCLAYFGVGEYKEWFKKSYDEQKAQLLTASGYTDWGDA